MTKFNLLITATILSAYIWITNKPDITTNRVSGGIYAIRAAELALVAISSVDTTLCISRHALPLTTVVMDGAAKRWT